LRASAIQPRAPQPSKALSQARANIVRLLAVWDDPLANTLFADNFFLDFDRPHWRHRLEELRRAHGKLQPEGAFEVENSLRGRWRMVGERGWCSVYITMSPTVPPRVQRLEIASTLPPSDAMHAAAVRLSELVTKPTRGSLQRLLSRDANLAVLWDRLCVANILCGASALGEVLSGDGFAHARFRLVGAKASAEVEITLDERTSKVLDLVFRTVS